MNIPRVTAHMEAYVAALDQAPDLTGMDFAVEQGWVDTVEHAAAKTALDLAMARSKRHLDAILAVRAEDVEGFCTWLLGRASLVKIDDAAAKAAFDSAIKALCDGNPGGHELKRAFQLLLSLPI